MHILVHNVNPAKLCALLDALAPSFDAYSSTITLHAEECHVRLPTSCSKVQLVSCPSSNCSDAYLTQHGIHVVWCANPIVAPSAPGCTTLTVRNVKTCIRRTKELLGQLAKCVAQSEPVAHHVPTSDIVAHHAPTSDIVAHHAPTSDIVAISTEPDLHITQLTETLSDALYLPSLGFDKNMPSYRHFVHQHATLLFSILKEVGLEYFVFAGTSVGYIRNQRNIPWVDDYDIIVFEEHIEFFESTVTNLLRQYGFIVFAQNQERFRGGGYYILSAFGQCCFQCDVFYTKTLPCGRIRNMGNWGRYNGFAVTEDMVRPKRELVIDDDLELPFFHQLEKDVCLEYGDVFNNCTFHINHGPAFTVHAPFQRVYDAFRKIQKKVETNTRRRFAHHTYQSHLTLDDASAFFQPCTTDSSLFNRSLYFLDHIAKHQVKRLYLLDQAFLWYCVDAKQFFPNLHIECILTRPLEPKYVVTTGYVDALYPTSREEVSRLRTLLRHVRNPPVVELNRVITFGTFDLFHHGHARILERARAYGELVVGVSTDALNQAKGKTAIDSEDVRKANVWRAQPDCASVFDEESLKLKPRYVKEHNAHLLVMGDDWANAFNHCECACLYLPRTPDISTTMLKERMREGGC